MIIFKLLTVSFLKKNVSKLITVYAVNLNKNINFNTFDERK